MLTIKRFVIANYMQQIASRLDFETIKHITSINKSNLHYTRKHQGLDTWFNKEIFGEKATHYRLY